MTKLYRYTFYALVDCNHHAMTALFEYSGSQHDFILHTKSRDPDQTVLGSTLLAT